MTTAAIIQARMGSTRLPGKILKPLLGDPMLSHVVRRVQSARLVDSVMVATTENPQDQVIVDLCEQSGWQVYRGSEDDVLDRYYQAARLLNATTIVRVTSDDPLIDSTVIDCLIATVHMLTPVIDYVSNNRKRSFPLGLDSEVFSFEALSRAWHDDQNPAWREHVTPFIYRNPDQFRLYGVTSPVDYSHHRWTVDTPEDYEFVTRIYEHFGHADFGWHDVLEVLDEHPDWLKINQHIEQKKV